MERVWRIGTRGSPLALAQAHEIERRLRAAHDLAPDAIEIVVLQTKGDQILDRALSELGGKGLFTKEIDDAQLDGRIDLAVHSMKDVPTVMPDGLEIAAHPEREDVRDAFVSPRAESLDALPAGALVGTASLRRQAQLLWRRPDLRVETFRGNVQTRLKKLEEGVADATFLALAGLNRLDLAHVARGPIETEAMLPAVAQGAIGVSIRSADDAARALLAPLSHSETWTRVTAERAFLTRLDGSCRTPLAGLADLLPDGRMRFRGEILKPDGSERHATERIGDPADAAALGLDAAEELLAAGGPGFLA